MFVFGQSAKWRLCEAFGIPVYLDLSLAILLFLFATSGGSFAFGLASAVLLLFSITAHELGHALTARAFGYQTRDITLSLLGGCASLIAMPRKASQELLTAIAGPLVSFALAGLAFVVFPFLPHRAYFEMALVQYVFWMNLMLGFFNLLPGFPLDGGRIFRSVLRAFLDRTRATYVAMIVGRVAAVGLGLWGVHRLFSGQEWGFVTCLIAWMIWKEGYREYLMAREDDRWESGWDGRYARVSPPPYGGSREDVEVRRDS